MLPSILKTGRPSSRKYAKHSEIKEDSTDTQSTHFQPYIVVLISIKKFNVQKGNLERGTTYFLQSNTRLFWNLTLHKNSMADFYHRKKVLYSHKKIYQKRKKQWSQIKPINFTPSPRLKFLNNPPTHLHQPQQPDIQTINTSL